MPTDRTAAIATKLATARREGTRISLSVEETPRDFAEGLRIQEAVVAAIGSDIVGWKVIELPEGQVLTAPILRSGVVAAGSTWRVGGPEPAGIELEIAFRMVRDVPASASVSDIRSAVDCAIVVYELCQSRLQNPADQPRHVALADCFFNSGVVLGPLVPDWKSQDLKGRTGRLLVDGQVRAEGKSHDPLRALECLVPALAARGKALKAGDVVITGSLIGLCWLTGRHALEGEIEGMGTVTLELQAAG